MHGPVLKNVFCPKCLIAVVLVDFDLQYWTLKVEHIYGHFQQHLYCACAETVIYELPV